MALCTYKTYFTELKAPTIESPEGRFQSTGLCPAIEGPLSAEQWHKLLPQDCRGNAKSVSSGHLTCSSPTLPRKPAEWEVSGWEKL